MVFGLLYGMFFFSLFRNVDVKNRRLYTAAFNAKLHRATGCC
jgi:hypothetical protein